MLDGMKNCAALEFNGVPLAVPSEESNTPFLPIWDKSLDPSWLYFCTIPEGELAIQTLLSLSKWQLCRRGSSRLASPQELMTLPAGSNSITAAPIAHPAIRRRAHLAG